MARRNVELSEDFDRDVEVEALCAHLADLISDTLERTETTRAELARRLSVSPAHITQTLSGQRNMTLRTVAEALYAMGHRLDCQVVPLAADEISQIKWVEDHEAEEIGEQASELRDLVLDRWRSRSLVEPLAFGSSLWKRGTSPLTTSPVSCDDSGPARGVLLSG